MLARALNGHQHLPSTGERARAPPSPPLIAALAAAGLVVVPVAPARTIAWQKEEAIAPSNIDPVTVASRHVTRFVVRRGDSPVHAASAPSASRRSRRRERRPEPAGLPLVDALSGDVRARRGLDLEHLHPVPRVRARRLPPSIALQVNTKKIPAMLRLQVRGGGLGLDCTPQQSRSWDFAPLTRGRWQDLELRVSWSDAIDGGSVELKLDGATIVARTALATLYSGQRAYLKQGFYRAPSSFTSTVWHSAVSVDPASS